MGERVEAFPARPRLRPVQRVDKLALVGNEQVSVIFGNFAENCSRILARASRGAGKGIHNRLEQLRILDRRLSGLHRFLRLFAHRTILRFSTNGAEPFR